LNFIIFFNFYRVFHAYLFNYRRLMPLKMSDCDRVLAQKWVKFIEFV